jgi:hypothetical protein
MAVKKIMKITSRFFFRSRSKSFLFYADQDFDSKAKRDLLDMINRYLCLAGKISRTPNSILFL